MMSLGWAPMMAAMMLPTAVPAIARRDSLRTAPLFAGSTIGLMAVLVALDPMSLPLMCALAAVVLIQKELFA